MPSFKVDDFHFPVYNGILSRPEQGLSRHEQNLSRREQAGAEGEQT